MLVGVFQNQPLQFVLICPWMNVNLYRSFYAILFQLFDLFNIRAGSVSNTYAIRKLGKDNGVIALRIA
jgi:hypothetical protein